MGMDGGLVGAKQSATESVTDRTPVSPVDLADQSQQGTRSLRERHSDRHRTVLLWDRSHGEQH